MATRTKSSNRGLLASLRKINDNLNQKIVNLENEIKILKSSKDVDVPKAELIKKLQAIEKSRDNAISNAQDRKQNIRQTQKSSGRLELELIDAKNEVVVLNKTNTDLTALIAKLSNKVNVITKGGSSTSSPGKEKSKDKTLKTKKASEKVKSSKSSPAKAQGKKSDEKKQKISKNIPAKPKKSVKAAKKSPPTKTKQDPKGVKKLKKKASSSTPKSKATAPSKKQPAKPIVVAANPKKPSKAATKSAVAKPKPAAAKTAKTKVAKITLKTPKNKSTESAPSDEKTVLGLLTQWKEKWEKRDAKTYIGFYSSRFKGRGMDLKSWNIYKTNNFRSKKNIQIKVTNINTVKTNNGDIVVKFLQHYKADKYSDIGLKALRWTKTSDGWKILRESWKPSKN